MKTRRPFDTTMKAPEPLQRAITESPYAVDMSRRPYFTVLDGLLPGQLHPLDDGITQLGRSADAPLCFAEMGVSRSHAEVTVQGLSVLVRDVGSTNGTWVDNKRIESATLSAGDKVRFGTKLLLRFDMFDSLDVLCAERLYRATTLDPLTDLPNRRYFEAELPREIAYTRRAGTSLALAYVDLDGFKEINDTYGHHFGDRILKHVAAELRDGFRPYDMVARWGGDEFAVILRDADLATAAIAIDRFMTRLRRAPGSYLPNGQKITVSVGVAATQDDGITDAHGLACCADSRLYTAKRAGRDRVAIATPTPTTDSKTLRSVRR